MCVCVCVCVCVCANTLLCVLCAHLKHILVHGLLPVRVFIRHTEHDHTAYICWPQLTRKKVVTQGETVGLQAEPRNAVLSRKAVPEQCLLGELCVWVSYA